MAIPRVFVSSTWYDLRYVRENLKYFIRTIGYEPILSEEGSIYFNPSEHIHESVISEVPNCQLFVLLIGGRYGSKFIGKDNSVTNEEYREAIRKHIPVFALVEQGAYGDYQVFQKNRENRKIDEHQIVYPSADSTKIFTFIEEVQKNAINNALVPFKDFSDIESYLRQQWAGMMFSFLASKNEESRVADIMFQIVKMNERVEFLSTQILKSVGSEEADIFIKLYDLMLDNESIKSLISTGHKPHPAVVLGSKTLEECAKNLGQPLVIKKNAPFSTSSSGEINKGYFELMEKDYSFLRSKMLDIVSKSGLSLEKLTENKMG